MAAKSFNLNPTLMVGGFGKGFNAAPKFTNISGGMAHPSFKFRVKPIAMASSFGTNKPLAFPKNKSAF